MIEDFMPPKFSIALYTPYDYDGLAVGTKQ